MAVVSVMKVDLPPMFVIPCFVAISACGWLNHIFCPVLFARARHHTAGYETPRTEGTAEARRAVEARIEGGGQARKPRKGAG
jgi:hypothetical protein